MPISVTRLGNFSKPVATTSLPKSPTFLGTFCKGVTIYHFLVKSFIDNFYKYLAIFLVTLCQHNLRLRKVDK